MNRRTEVVAANLVVRGTGILMVRDAKPEALGRWSLPAGRVEAGESLAAAAEREAREETGLVVEARDLIGIYHAPDTLEGGSALQVVFRSEVVGGELAVSPEHPAVGFLDRAVLERLIRERRVRGTHLALVLAAHDTGVRLPPSTIVDVPPSAPPAT